MLSVILGNDWISVVQCSGLNPDWTNMDTTSSFPVPAGTVLSLSCNDGYELKGDSKVTCTEDTEFQFSEKPNCGELKY